MGCGASADRVQESLVSVPLAKLFLWRLIGFSIRGAECFFATRSYAHESCSRVAKVIEHRQGREPDTSNLRKIQFLGFGV